MPPEDASRPNAAGPVLSSRESQDQLLWRRQAGLSLLPSLMCISEMREMQYEDLGNEGQEHCLVSKSVLGHLRVSRPEKHETEAIVLSFGNQQKNPVEASSESHQGSQPSGDLADGRSSGPGERAGACRERKGNGQRGRHGGAQGTGARDASITEITWNPSFQDAFGS